MIERKLSMRSPTGQGIQSTQVTERGGPFHVDDPIIEIRGLSKSYGEGEGAKHAIGNVELSVRKGEFLTVIGPSGCGKTTLLMCVAGLRKPTAGTIHLHNQEVKEPLPGVAIVFQDYSQSLFPWYSNGKNIALALGEIRPKKWELRERVRASLAAVDLADVEHLYPWQLSGGMQQRVAIARALITSPEVLLMDEPFASVDAQTRAVLEDLVLDVWERLQVTILLVTHDIDEAVYLSSRLAVLSHRPSRVIDEIEVTLPRPRDQLETRSSPEFARIRSRVFEQVMPREHPK